MNEFRIGGVSGYCPVCLNSKNNCNCYQKLSKIFSKMENYFIISNSDGDTNIECVNREELLKRINENYYGEVDYLGNIPDNTDTNYWGNGVVIIKGDIVTPNPEEIVTKYNIK